MAVRGVRGATTVTENEKGQILERTEELLRGLVERNTFEVEDIASVIFSVTDDIDDEFPAVAARKMGWIFTPLFCVREIPVKGSLRKCIRVLLHINTEKKQSELVQLYLHEARKLRPDLETGGSLYYSSE